MRVSLLILVFVEETINPPIGMGILWEQRWTVPPETGGVSLGVILFEANEALTRDQPKDRSRVGANVGKAEKLVLVTIARHLSGSRGQYDLLGHVSLPRTGSPTEVESTLALRPHD